MPPIGTGDFLVACSSPLPKIRESGKCRGGKCKVGTPSPLTPPGRRQESRRSFLSKRNLIPKKSVYLSERLPRQVNEREKSKFAAGENMYGTFFGGTDPVWRRKTNSNPWERDEVLEPEPAGNRGEHGDDTIYAYLKEMGSIPLLTAHREIEVARQLAHGRERIADSLYRCPIAVGELLVWGQRLQVGEMRIREIARLNSDVTSGVEPVEWFRAPTGGYCPSGRTGATALASMAAGGSGWRARLPGTPGVGPRPRHDRRADS